MRSSLLSFILFVSVLIWTTGAVSDNAVGGQLVRAPADNVPYDPQLILALLTADDSPLSDDMVVNLLHYAPDKYIPDLIKSFVAFRSSRSESVPWAVLQPILTRIAASDPDKYARFLDDQLRSLEDRSASRGLTLFSEQSECDMLLICVLFGSALIGSGTGPLRYPLCRLTDLVIGDAKVFERCCAIGLLAQVLPGLCLMAENDTILADPAGNRFLLHISARLRDDLCKSVEFCNFLNVLTNSIYPSYDQRLELIRRSIAGLANESDQHGLRDGSGDRLKVRLFLLLCGLSPDQILGMIMELYPLLSGVSDSFSEEFQHDLALFAFCQGYTQQILSGLIHFIRTKNIVSDYFLNTTCWLLISVTPVDHIDDTLQGALHFLFQLIPRHVVMYPIAAQVLGQIRIGTLLSVFRNMPLRFGNLLQLFEQVCELRPLREQWLLRLRAHDLMDAETWRTRYKRSLELDVIARALSGADCAWLAVHFSDCPQSSAQLLFLFTMDQYGPLLDAILACIENGHSWARSLCTLRLVQFAPAAAFARLGRMCEPPRSSRCLDFCCGLFALLLLERPDVAIQALSDPALSADHALRILSGALHVMFAAQHGPCPDGMDLIAYLQLIYYSLQSAPAQLLTEQGLRAVETVVLHFKFPSFSTDAFLRLHALASEISSCRGRRIQHFITAVNE